jgi:hypothetical protein
VKYDGRGERKERYNIVPSFSACPAARARGSTEEMATYHGAVASNDIDLRCHYYGSPAHIR